MKMHLRMVEATPPGGAHLLPTSKDFHQEFDFWMILSKEIWVIAKYTSLLGTVPFYIYIYIYFFSSENT